MGKNGNKDLKLKIKNNWLFDLTNYFFDRAKNIKNYKVESLINFANA